MDVGGGLVQIRDLSDMSDLPTGFTRPIRSDLILTYACNNSCPHCYAGQRKAGKPMILQDWYRAIDRLHQAGILHATITGGEATTVDFLPSIVSRCQSRGMLTGLITNGRLLGTRDMARKLKKAGLDHVQITLLGASSSEHDSLAGCDGAFVETLAGIREAREAGLWTITNTTITRRNIPDAGKAALFVDFLDELGLRTFAMNAVIASGGGRSFGDTVDAGELGPIVESVKTRARLHGMKMIWYTPSRYCEFDPTAHGLGIKHCSAALSAISVEPDGTVLPCQSCFISLGNILQTPFEKIWNSPTAVMMRTHDWAPEKCRTCEKYQECGGGCPLELDGFPDR